MSRLLTALSTVSARSSRPAQAGCVYTQSGLVHNYAMTMVLGMVVIVAFYIFS